MPAEPISPGSSIATQTQPLSTQRPTNSTETLSEPAINNAPLREITSSKTVDDPPATNQGEVAASASTNNNPDVPEPLPKRKIVKIAGERVPQYVYYNDVEPKASGHKIHMLPPSRNQRQFVQEAIEKTQGDH